MKSASPHSGEAIARALAEAFLNGELAVDEMVERGSRLLGRRWRWLRPLAGRVCEAFGVGTRPRRIVVAQFLLADAEFARAQTKHELRIVERLAPAAEMQPVAAAQAWRVPAIRSVGELAEWLKVGIGELYWFADPRGLESKRNAGKLRNYHYRPLAKRTGEARLIEAPKPRLKEIQRQILSEILEQIPAHDASHGFRRGYSIKTFAAPHVGRRVVLRLDLRNFFPSIRAARVQALFRTIGYAETVADLLAGLCTNGTPDDVWDALEADRWSIRDARRLYARRHLPQGAPTSPALGNLCAYRLDCRLAKLASSAGAVYTRYADDLAFSGGREFERVVGRFRIHVCAVASEEGFSVRHRKTRVMRQGVRQRLAGIVVNEHANVPREDYDRLKATLTNCVRHGAASQNRAGHDDFRAHLLGRVSFVEMVNSARGRRLRALFDRIEW